MMQICDRRHVRIIHEEENCPLCLIKEELKDVESELSGVLNNLEELRKSDE